MFEEESAAEAGHIKSSHAPMPGIVEKVLVKAGDEVTELHPGTESLLIFREG